MRLSTTRAALRALRWHARGSSILSNPDRTMMMVFVRSRAFDFVRDRECKSAEIERRAAQQQQQQQHQIAQGLLLLHRNDVGNRRQRQRRRSDSSETRQSESVRTITFAFLKIP